MDAFEKCRISHGSKTEILTEETTNKIYESINTLSCKGTSLVIPMSKYNELINMNSSVFSCSHFYFP